MQAGADRAEKPAARMATPLRVGERRARGGDEVLSGANRKVGTMGDCLGGRLAFMMAVQSDADVNVSDYGVGLDDLLGDRAKVAETLVVAPGQRPEAWCAAWMHRATSASGR